MKKILFFVFISLVSSLYAQKVTNAAFQQSGKQVEITYSLDKQADITVYVSTDGGKTYGSALTAVTGDVGKQVAAGTNKQIKWSPLEEREQIVSDNVAFKIVPSGGDTWMFTINGVPFTMIKVEGGTFTMGCTSAQGTDCLSYSRPAHRVTVNDYYIGQTEVTQGLWSAVMEIILDPCNHWGQMRGVTTTEGKDYPMCCISWADCQAFCAALNAKLVNELGDWEFAIPTEAQWEYAARGGKRSKGYKYSGSNRVEDVGWTNLSITYGGMHKVAEKKSNELGIYDMSGNAMEWCYDWWLDHYESASPVSNPTGPSSGLGHVNRGGAWFQAYSGAVYDRSWELDYKGEPSKGPDLGFRLALIKKNKESKDVVE